MDRYLFRGLAFGDRNQEVQPLKSLGVSTIHPELLEVQNG